MDVSNAMNRLDYNVAGPEEGRDECEEAFWFKTTLDRNLSGTLSFVVPPDGTAFTDVNAAYISVTFRVVRANGDHLDDSDLVFLTPGTLQSLFDRCQIFLNGDALDPTNAYSWGATLTSYLGMSKVARSNVWAPLAGMNLPGVRSSKLKPGSETSFIASMQSVAGSKEVTLTGRLMSDFMQSCAHLLPPGVKLEVNLQRARDNFTLCCTTLDPSVEYKIEMSLASLFLRRVQMCKPVLERTMSSIASGGGLTYTRMGCIVNQVPAEGVSYRVGNLFGGGELPHTLYLVLANQQAFSGAHHYLANYFESGHVKSLQVYRNGRPVLTQPMRTKYVYNEKNPHELDIPKSNAQEPFLSMAMAMNGIADSHISSGMGYGDFMAGCIVSCVQLNSCGGTRTSPGFLDVELVLDDAPRDPMLLLAFGEFDKTLRFDKNLHILPN